jgi:hypothetical protein
LRSILETAECCIYQKPREFGESSTESDVSSDESDGGPKRHKSKKKHSHHDHKHHHGDDSGAGGNAYEPQT